ncbi:MAG: hypothetical protein MZV64_73005 [Ignavibacteriales bacterium]|nr:hypothetical protein [Ignavibacteriales bacterium]
MAPGDRACGRPRSIVDLRGSRRTEASQEKSRARARPRADSVRAQVGVAEHPLDAFGDRRRAVGVDQHGGVADHLRQRRRVRRDHRRAAGHRLERRQAEALVAATGTRTRWPAGRARPACRPARSRGSARACAACACPRRGAASGSFEIWSPMISSFEALEAARAAPGRRRRSGARGSCAA